MIRSCVGHEIAHRNNVGRAVLLLVVLLGVSMPGNSEEAPAKPRVIATTDGEIDDRCTMVRFLLYANEWDIRGIVHSSSKFHWKGDATYEGKDWRPMPWLDRQLEAYGAVYPNLKKHDAAYPRPEYLKSKVYVGNIAYVGDMRAATPGSDRIMDVLLEADDSPVWLQAWGGSNTIARALKTIKEEHPNRVAEVSRKARLFLIAEQDKTLREYIRPEWPGVQVLLSDWPSFEAIAYPWKKCQPKELHPYFDKAWMTTNMLENHGPLCGMYEAKEGRFRSEGDTPAFLHVIGTGLRGDEHPTYGGWGGRFSPTEGFWKTQDVRNVWPHSILRWAKDFQNDWAARADWCVKSYEDANHPPQVALSHGADLTARPGDEIKLNVSDSSDPDDDQLSFNWWNYAEAGSYGKPVKIKDAKNSAATTVIPADASPGKTIHVICSVTDSGKPPLTRYARVIVTVGK
jgi:hypothetical protein